jgi:hypothetical protein
MGDDREINRRKEISPETTSLFLTPGEARVVSQHEVVHQISLHWPQEVARVILVELVSLLEGIVVGGCEWQRFGVESW